MRIGAIGFHPYVYRVNAVSASSLSRVQAIGDDLLASKTDFSGLLASGRETINPLRRGQSANFADILSMQMQMSRMNAQRVVGPTENVKTEEAPDDRQQPEASMYQTRRAAESYHAAMMVM